MTAPYATVAAPHVLGLDLSLTSTGIAHSTGELARIRSTGTHDATLAQRRTRLVRLVDALLGHIDIGPDLVVLEAPSMGSRHGHPHDRSGLWWLIAETLLREGIPLAEVAPACRARYATGKGNAGKDEVLAATVKRFGDFEVTGNDVADALILCAMGADHLGAPLTAMPAAHRVALTGVAWPVVPVRSLPAAGGRL